MESNFYFSLYGISAIYMQNRQFHSKWFIAAFSQLYLSGNWHYYILPMFVLIFIKYTKVIEREPVSLQESIFYQAIRTKGTNPIENWPDLYIMQFLVI